MEDEFHEMDDLNVEQQEEENYEEETSFIDEQSDSTRQLFNRVWDLNQLIKKNNVEEIRRRADRIIEARKLQKRVDDLTEQENIRLQEILDKKSRKNKSD